MYMMIRILPQKVLKPNMSIDATWLQLAPQMHGCSVVALFHSSFHLEFALWLRLISRGHENTF